MDLFLIEFQELLKSYNEEGPLTPGLMTAESSVKLKPFRHQYDNFRNND
jgi:hypothetical protein